MNLTDATNVADREIISTRVLNASRELVWEAWANPKHLAIWWGPRGFTNTFSEFDFRVGGHWKFVMHGPDGADYPNHSTFVEIAKPERIVFDHVCAPEFQVTATLSEQGGKTKLTFRMLFKSAEVCARLKGICVPSNEENFDRLEAELMAMTAAKGAK